MRREAELPPEGDDDSGQGLLEAAESEAASARETAVLVGVQLKGMTAWEVSDNLDELEQLADTAGVGAACRAVQHRERPDASTFLGRGKVSRLAELCAENHAQLVIFDDDLSPAQGRNLEKLLKRRVIDRSELILDIFARRARTREARIQVELAQLEYLRPRLTRRWTHLSRQEGGVGTSRGPGETQLEIDRRTIGHRISHLKQQLAGIEKARRTRRRRRSEVFKVAIIGYTNAGKSTLLNALTNADVFVEDRLFATLDATVRGMRLDDGKRALLIDTVGFIRKLPVGLVASFRSTLEESRSADLFINVVDLSHPHWESQMADVEVILRELELDKTPQILAFNKVDAVVDTPLLDGLSRQFPDALFISALRGIRLYQIGDRIKRFMNRKWVRGQRSFAPQDADKLKAFEEEVNVVGRSFRDGKIIIEFLVQAESGSK